MGSQLPYKVSGGRRVCVGLASAITLGSEIVTLLKFSDLVTDCI